MSDSPTKGISDKETAPYPDRETVTYAPRHSDVETGDHGIKVVTAPLARELKGRHMQMIAIGIYPIDVPQQLPDVCFH